MTEVHIITWAYGDGSDFGWKDPRMALLYFNPRAADIANLL